MAFRVPDIAVGYRLLSQEEQTSLRDPSTNGDHVSPTTFAPARQFNPILYHHLNHHHNHLVPPLHRSYFPSPAPGTSASAFIASREQRYDPIFGRPSAFVFPPPPFHPLAGLYTPPVPRAFSLPFPPIRGQGRLELQQINQPSSPRFSAASSPSVDSSLSLMPDRLSELEDQSPDSPDFDVDSFDGISSPGHSSVRSSLSDSPGFEGDSSEDVPRPGALDPIEHESIFGPPPGRQARASGNSSPTGNLDPASPSNNHPVPRPRLRTGLFPAFDARGNSPPPLPRRRIRPSLFASSGPSSSTSPPSSPDNMPPAAASRGRKRRAPSDDDAIVIPDSDDIPQSSSPVQVVESRPVKRRNARRTSTTTTSTTLPPRRESAGQCSHQAPAAATSTTNRRPSAVKRQPSSTRSSVSPSAFNTPEREDSVVDLVGTDSIPVEPPKPKVDNTVKLAKFQCVICMDDCIDITVTHCGMFLSPFLPLSRPVHIG